MHLRAAILLLCCQLLCGHYLLAQAIVLEDGYGWTDTPLNNDKDPSRHKFQTMLSDAEGYVWIASYSGLKVFDGLTFRYLDGPPLEGTDNYEISLAAGPGNTIFYTRHSFIGLTGYLPSHRTLDISLVDRELQRIVSFSEYFADNPPPVPSHDIVNCFCQDEGRDCFFGAKGGRVLRLRDGVWATLSLGGGAGGLLQYATFSAHNQIWLVYPRRYLVLDAEGKVLHSRATDEPNYQIRIKQGEQTSNAGWSLPNKFKRAKLPAIVGEPAPLPTALPPYSDEWFQLDEFDLFNFRYDRLSERLIIADDQEQELGSLDIERAGPIWLVDRQGRFWFREREGYRIGQIGREDISQALTSGDYPTSVRGIMSARDGSIYANTYRGVYRLVFAGEEVQVDTIVPNQLGAVGLGLSAAGGDTLLSGVYMMGYRTIETDSRVTTTHTVLENSEGFVTFQVLRASDGQLWRLHTDGISRLNASGDWAVVEKEKTHGKSFYFAEEIDQRVFAASSAGLWEFAPEPGGEVAARCFFPELSVSHFALHRDTFYLATDSSLVIWPRGEPEYELLNLQFTGLSPALHSVIFASGRQVFLSSNHGILVFDPLTRQVRKLTEEDGMPNIECNRLAHHQGADGRLYFGTVNGIAHFHPDSLRQLAMPPRIGLKLATSEVLRSKVGYVPIPRSVKDGALAVRLQPRDNSLRLSFSLPGNSHVNTVGIRYRSLASPTKWIPVTDGVLEWNRPAPGEYKLKFEASLPDGSMAGPGLLLNVTVVAPIYRRGWFISASLILFAVSTIAYVIRQNRKAEEREAELKAKVTEATATIAADRERLQLQKNDLGKLNEEKRQLLAVIGHDLRGPLLSLKGMKSKMDYLASNGQLQRLDEVSSDVERVIVGCYNTLDNLLMIHRQANNQAIKQPLYLAEIAADQLEFLQPVASLLGITLRLDAEQTESAIVGVQYGVTSLIRNLIMNAIQHSPAGCEVTVTVESHENNLSLLVRDEGLGMTRETKNRLTQPLATTLAWSPGAKSAGLGWVIVRTVAREHGAVITISDAEPHGTLVEVQFAKNIT